MSFGAEEHGGWRRGTDCKCPKSKKKLTQLKLVETPVTNPVVSGVFTILSPFVPHPVYHMAIECYYRCSQCDSTNYYTFEFSGVGM